MNCRKCIIEVEERDLRREHLSGAAEAHLGICANCRVFCEERLALCRLVGDLEKFPAPADFDFRMRARMAAEMGTRSPRPGWFNFTPATLSWPLLAGCLALLISASLYLQQRQTDAPMTPTEPTSFLSPAPKVEGAKSTDEGAKVIKHRPSVDTKTVKIMLPQRGRVSPERIVANTRAETARVKVRIEESNSASVSSAPLKFAASGATRSESEMIPVQLTTPERPLKLLLRDTSGGERTISVDSVSFGSRDTIGRSATFKGASLSSNQGVW